MTEFARERSEASIERSQRCSYTQVHLPTWSQYLVIHIAPTGSEELAEDGCELGDGDISSADDHVMRDAAIRSR